MGWCLSTVGDKMTESGGAGRGKTLAWRSRSSRDMDMDKDMGNRDAVGSVSGRDIGRDIANWWSSAVEQTSSFIRDEVDGPTQTFCSRRELYWKLSNLKFFFSSK